MTPRQFFAYCDLAQARYRSEQAAMLAQTATAFHADAKHIQKVIKEMIAE